MCRHHQRLSRSLYYLQHVELSTSPCLLPVSPHFYWAHSSTETMTNPLMCLLIKIYDAGYGEIRGDFNAINTHCFNYGQLGVSGCRLVSFLAPAECPGCMAAGPVSSIAQTTVQSGTVVGNSFDQQHIYSNHQHNLIITV